MVQVPKTWGAVADTLDIFSIKQTILIRQDPEKMKHIFSWGIFCSVNCYCCRFKEKYLRAMDQVAAAATTQETTQLKLGEDNVGNKMLQVTSLVTDPGDHVGSELCCLI